jgi:AcrR family transcriptional regulator
VTEPDRIRRRDAAQTKARILVAAQTAFSERGFSQTGIRDIAIGAGVNSALVNRYFGSKAGLFEAALIDAIPDVSDLDLGHDGFGANLTKWFQAGLLDLRAQAMIAFSVNDPEAHVICARVLEAHAIKPLSEWLGPPNARARAVRITMLATSFMLYTRQITLLTPDEAAATETADWLAKSLQAIIDERQQ